MVCNSHCFTNMKGKSQACGANKKKFSMVFMHSDVATNLENLKLVKHLVYTDAEGIERPLDLAAWNGKIVIIDDEMPTEQVESVEQVGKEGDANYVAAQEAYTKYTSCQLRILFNYNQSITNQH